MTNRYKHNIGTKSCVYQMLCNLW